MKKFMRLFHNKKFDQWETCKRCDGKRIFIMPSVFEELVLGKMGCLVCQNCGDKEQV